MKMNIYKFNVDPNITIYGSYGYIINNKKAQIIYEKLLTITKTIDCQLFDIIRSGIIQGYSIKANIVNHSGFSETTVRKE
jgi:hypothetical protein